MGYLGPGSFDNDQAMDWLADFRDSISMRKLTAPISAYEKYLREGPTPAMTLSQTQIEQIISAQLAFWRQYPPPGWEREAPTIDEWLADEESRKREFYGSKRYLDEEYGPVEIAIAASELIAALGGFPAPVYPAEVTDVLRACKSLKVKIAHVSRAKDVVDGVLDNHRYYRMRTMFLDAFPKVTRGADDMTEVKKLRDRLGRAANQL